MQGTKETWTSWIPVGDCPARLGSQAILRGSHLNGYLPIYKLPGAGGIATHLCEKENEWVGGNIGVGDVLTFTSLTVHRALPTQHPEQVRISMDARYQNSNDGIYEGSLGNHSGVEWDVIYKEWQGSDTDLKYYWKGIHPPFVPRDSSLQDPGGPASVLRLGCVAGSKKPLEAGSLLSSTSDRYSGLCID